MKKQITLLRTASILFLFGGIMTVQAQLVTTGADDGSAGSLRNQVASANSGAIILIAPLVTNIVLTSGEITIDKSLVITGNGLTNTSINGNSASRIFNITNGNVFLNNLTLTNGVEDNGGAVSVSNANLTITASVLSNNVADGVAGSGGAIIVNSGANLTVIGSTLNGNRANRAGGGIESVAGTTVTLTDVILADNNAGNAPAVAAPGNGGGLHITGAGTAVITGGTVSTNTAAAEGGGLWNGAGTMTINSTTISENTASGVAADNGGGGIYNLDGGILNIDNSDITNNVANGAAGSGGGILNDVGSTLNVSGSVISGNTSNRAGGGIENNAGTVTLTNVELTGNTTFTSPGNGGGLHITGAGTANITGGIVNNNIAGSEGGGLWNGTSTMTVTGTTVSQNTASGALADNGGGGFYNLSGGTLTITGAMISANTATGAAGSGGGILNDVGSILNVSDTQITANTANRAGGGIENNAGTVTLTDVSLNGNTTFTSPGNGGGMHITSAGTATLTNGTVNGNNAGAEGGGLWNGTGTMTITGTTINGNTASGAGADQGGGAIYNLNAGTLIITDATISGNNANGTLGSGGGILNDVGSQLTVTNSTISGNTAVRAGGGIEDNSGTSTIVLNDVNLDNNTVTGPPGNGGGLHITGAGSVTITGGTVNGNSATLEGGGLWNGSGTMSVTGTTINANISTGAAADDGGAGIFNTAGTVTLDDVNVTNNIASGTSGSGGGLFSLAGTVNVTNSTFNNNSANRAGGAVEIVAGTFNFTDSEMTNNDVNGGAGTANPGNGGGLHLSGVVTAAISGSVVTGNEAKREGGGLWNQTGSTMSVTNTTVDSNFALGLEAIHGGGGIFNNGGDLTVNASTISNNMTDGGALGNGGGIHVKTGTATIMVSTISGNSSVNDGGGIYNNAALTINASTVADNEAEELGGGVANGPLATTTLIKNTLLALNTSTTGFDISASAAIVSGGYNLIGQDGQNVFTENSTDIEGTMANPSNPLVGPLADNGGMTLTHALLPNSPAYNAGNPADLFNDQTNSPVFESIRDIGAFESQAVLANNSFVAGSTKSSTIYPNPSVNGRININIAQGFGSDISGKIVEVGSGKVVMTFKANESVNEINHGFAAGVYVVYLSSENTSETHKLVVN